MRVVASCPTVLNVFLKGADARNEQAGCAPNQRFVGQLSQLGGPDRYMGPPSIGLGKCFDNLLQAVELRRYLLVDGLSCLPYGFERWAGQFNESYSTDDLIGSGHPVFNLNVEKDVAHFGCPLKSLLRNYSASDCLSEFLFALLGRVTLKLESFYLAPLNLSLHVILLAQQVV